MPVRLAVTAGTEADCRYAGELIEGIDAEYLLADRAYDTNALLEMCKARGIEAVIPSKRHRKSPRQHDEHIYRKSPRQHDEHIYRKSPRQHDEHIYRKSPRQHDEHIYRHRHLVENAFLWLKRWRRIATRYAKNADSFLAAVHIRCLAIWTKIL